MTTPVNSSTPATSASSAAAGSPTTANDMSERFLKLLVAQMKNQDPLNPMDNAEVTTQMAQINTVSGIQQLNDTMSGLSTTFTQTQLLQGASLVGRSVLTQGDRLTVENGSATAGYELASAADSVTVDVVSAGGQVLETLKLGPQAAGQHGFAWEPDAGVATAGVKFKVTATSGTQAVTATALVPDTVQAITTSNNSLTLLLRNTGAVSYNNIRTIS